MKTEKEIKSELVDLYVSQVWLMDKQDAVNELVALAKTRKSIDLLFHLLRMFRYLDSRTEQLLLEEMARYIVNIPGACEANTQITALAFDDSSDSSQKVLDKIKMPLYELGWSKYREVNKIGRAVKAYKDGFTNIVLVDEFIGSGQTLMGRIDYLSKQISNLKDVHVCYMVGIKAAIQAIKTSYPTLGMFCALEIKKGISEYFANEELVEAIIQMRDLESSLAEIINEHNLRDYSFGFNRAEALYSLEGCNGNTPNSVFPLFWWNYDTENNKRKTLLRRRQAGML